MDFSLNQPIATEKQINKNALIGCTCEQVSDSSEFASRECLGNETNDRQKLTRQAARWSSAN